MINELQTQLQKALDHLRAEFGKLQMGTANASILDAVEVSMYGAKSPLKNGANVSVMDAKTLKIEPWDKSIMAEIEKGITAANLGLNPQNMGEYIIIPIPPMTEERRKNTVKVVHQESENAKIAVRNIRQDFMKKKLKLKKKTTKFLKMNKRN